MLHDGRMMLLCARGQSLACGHRIERAIPTRIRKAVGTADGEVWLEHSHFGSR